MTFLGIGLMLGGIIMIILAFFKLLVPILFFLFQFIIAGFMGLVGEIHNFLFMQSKGTRELNLKKAKEKNRKAMKEAEQEKSREATKEEMLLYVVKKKSDALRVKYPLADESLIDDFIEAYKTRPLCVSEGIADRIAKQHEKRAERKARFRERIQESMEKHKKH